jgi:GxxExxY protein
LGPGFKELAYENALIKEFEIKAIKYVRQVPVDIICKGVKVCKHRIDLVIEDTVIVELKAVRNFVVDDTKRLLSYLKAMKKKIGLLINFARSKIEIKTPYSLIRT